MLVPTDVDREEGILLVFAGLFSLDIVAVTVPVEAGIEDTCWWIVLVNAWECVELLSLFATGVDYQDFQTLVAGLYVCCIFGAIR